MATALQNLIDAYIKRNANQEITGPVLNGVLTAISNALGTPFIGSDGYWYTYDAESGQFVKTDTPAQGETGPVGVTEAAATIDDQIGTPSVSVSLDGTRLDFAFRNLKGQKGDTGDAGITAAVVTVDAGIGTPSVDASITGTTLTVAFHNLKGETGAAAGFGTIEATVDDTTGTPAVVVTESGPDTAKNLSFAFSGLKGPKGDQGDTGVSADYPITIANNLTTDDPTAALAASQGVVLKGEIDQLGQKVDDISTGKYYGYYATAADLPETGADGFAYVGSGPTYTIYNRSNGVWASSGVTVNQSPIGNEEDIDQNASGKLQFADRVYNAQQPDGMGYVILRKNKTFAEQVTDTNTIYEIRYDFDLDNASVMIPAGCVLKFEGGSLDNGTVIFNGAEIESCDMCFLSGLIPSGLPVVRAEWFGMTPSSADISATFNRLAAILEIKEIVFKSETYHTASTLVCDRSAQSLPENKMFSIVGDPTFFCDTRNIACVELAGVTLSNLEFNVERQLPSQWGDAESVGALLINITQSKISIKRVTGFTYGIICRADGLGGNAGGFAWNDIFCVRIYSALQSFVIESINDGWPNANTARLGMIGATNTGTYSTTGATEPMRDIVFKSDGTYGADSWMFSGIFIEHHNDPSIDGRPVVPIDICDYIPSSGSFAYSNISIEARIETDTANLIKVRSRNIVNRIVLNGTPMEGYKVAEDENGNDVTGALVNVVSGTQDDRVCVHIEDIKYPDGKDLVSTDTKLSLGKRFFGIGSYGIPQSQYGEFGYANKGVCLSGVAGCCFTIIRNVVSDFYIHFYNEKMEHIDPSLALLDPLGYNNPIYRSNLPSPYKNFWDSQDGYPPLSFSVRSSSPAKFMIISVTNGGNISIIQNIDVFAPSASRAKLVSIYYPLGKCGADTYSSALAFTSLRAAVNAGDRYIQETNGALTLVRKGGSLGSFSATATGTAGENVANFSSVSGLVVGDYISIDGTEYTVTSISGTSVGLSKPLPSSIVDAAVSFVTPLYTTINA